MPTQFEKSRIFLIARQLLYLLGAFGIMFVQFALASVYHENTFDEFMWVENIQSGLLLFSALTFTAAGIRRPAFRGLCLALASLCMLAVCRELDSFLDEKVPVVSWRIGFLFMAAAFVYACRRFRAFLAACLEFAGMPSFFMMMCSMIIVVPVAQLIGHKPFLLNVLVEYDHIGPIKELFEECAETMGYFCLGCSAIEMLCNLWNDTKRA